MPVAARGEGRGLGGRPQTPVQAWPSCKVCGGPQVTAGFTVLARLVGVSEPKQGWKNLILARV